MKTLTLLSIGALAVVVGCDSEVVGGGGGSGGAGGSTAETTSGQGGVDTSGQSGTSSVDVASTGVGGAGGQGSGGQGSGGSNALGVCESQGGTGATSSGVFECGSDYSCEGGEVSVTCLDDGTGETCDCYLDGELGGTCVDDGDGCSFPVSCCYALLGGEAEPNPGPYGACEAGDGSSAQSGGGETACGATYECDGGELWIDCSGDASSATCECRDGQGFLLATCEQETVDCDYASGCCFALVN